MKSRILALVAVFMLCIVSVMAQSPGRFNYQGVVRDASNNPYINQDVGIRFTVLNSSLVSVYTETQSLTTNNLGLVNTTVGDVNPTAFDAVEWGSDEYLLQIELDLGDNGSWETDEIRDLNSVPYAMHASTADRVLEESIWQESGTDIYFSQGNAGLGVSTPLYPLHIVSNQLSGRDTLIYLQAADDPASALIFGNGTISDNKFMPAIMSVNGADHRQSLFITAQTTDELDDLGGFPLMSFDARRTESEILNRPLFQWSSYANPKMTMLANGNLGIGTPVPESKVHIQGDDAWADEDPLFEVKNADGVPVFAVYNNGVRILVEDDPDAKGSRGGFSVGGFEPAAKGYNQTFDFMRISPDSIRFNINNTAGKGPRGGFAVGGFERAAKEPINENFMYITPQSSADGLLNTFLGFQSGENNSGEHNTFIGSFAGNSNRGGSYNNFIGYNAGNVNMSGSSNCFIGNGAGRSNEGGSGNVFLGNGSGMNNTEGVNNIYIGTNSGLWYTKGDNNIIIGVASGGSPMEERNNTIKIGAYAGFDDPGSDRLYIDGSPDGRDISTSLIYGNFAEGAKELRVNGSIFYTGSIGEVSDSRLKTNLFVIDNVLDKIQEFNGYYFDWNSTAKESLIVNEKHQIGVLAQEIEKVFPELVSEMEEGYKTVDYANLTPILLQAVKEQQAMIESLSNEVDELKQMVATMLEKQE